MNRYAAWVKTHGNVFQALGISSDEHGWGNVSILSVCFCCIICRSRTRDGDWVITGNR